MILLRGAVSGASFSVDEGDELAGGGQARIYGVAGRPDLVAKLYHRSTLEQEARVRSMVAHPPAGPAQEGVSLTWPLDLLEAPGGDFVGLVLPRLDEMRRLFELYNPATRREVAPLFHYGLLHGVARRLASAFDALHAQRYVVGDVNESNVLASDAGEIWMIDTDSYQVTDPDSGTVYLCHVGRPEYTPPELQGRSLAGVERTVEQDRFGLAVLVFQLLMEGTHPFAGRWEGSGDPPPISERIRLGASPYVRSPLAGVQPRRTAPPVELLTPALRELLDRCLVAGHPSPSERPAALEWEEALTSAEAALIRCSRNEQHLFGPHLDACPWCARTTRLRGSDPFPASRQVSRGAHLVRHAPRRPTVARQGPGTGLITLLWRVLPAGLANQWAWASLGASVLTMLTGFWLWPLLAVATVPLAWRHPMRTSRGGPRFAWTVTVLAGLLTWSTVGQWLSPPPPGPAAARISASAPPALPPFSYDFAALTDRPRLLDSIPLIEAVSDLPPSISEPAPQPGEMATVLSFVVDEHGVVDPNSLVLSGAGDTTAVKSIARYMTAVPFAPGNRSGLAVRAHVSLPITWESGRARPLISGATWNPGVEEKPHIAEGKAGGVMTVDSLDRQPVLANKDEIARNMERLYPRAPQDQGVGGTTVVQYAVQPTGVIDSSSIVVISATSAGLVAPSVAAVTTFRFEPGLHHGKPVRVLVQMPITWQPAQ